MTFEAAVQTGGAPDRSNSSRILSFAFFFFILIIVASYTANLAAFLTLQRLRSPITRLEDLRVCNCQFGIRNGTAQYELFLTAPLYRPFVHNLVAFSTNDEAVAALRRGDIAAFIGDTPVLQYIENHPPCDTLIAGAPFAAAVYAFPVARTRPDFEFLLSQCFLRLQESGELDSLYRKWWSDNGSCLEPNSRLLSPGGVTQIGVYTLRGLFIVLGALFALSLLVLIVEIIWHRIHASYFAASGDMPAHKRWHDKLNILLGGGPFGTPPPRT